jgi:hypothetical protein
MKSTNIFSLLLLTQITAILPGSNVLAQNADMPKPGTTPDAVETRIGTLKFERGYPTEETKRKVFDEIDYERAVQCYLWSYPAVSFQSFMMK